MLRALKNLIAGIDVDETRLLSIIAEKTDNAVIITDANGLILWVNQGFTDLTGYTLEEVKGKKPGHILQGKDTDPKTVQRIREHIARKESFRENILNYDKDGTPYWIQLNVTPVFNDLGILTNFIAFELDVTEEVKRQKELEQAKIQIESQLSQLKAYNEAINLTLGFLEIGLDNKIILVNDKLAQILGYSKEELIGKNHRDLVGYLNTDEQYKQDWENLLKEGKAEGEFQRIRKDGQLIWLQAVYMVVKDIQTNQPKSIIKLAIEITEKKLQEKEIYEKNQELLASEEELRMAQEELNAINEDLKIKAEALENSLKTIQNAQEQLRTLSMVAANTDNAVIITNANGEIEWVNPAFTRISGYTLEEVKGKIPGRILQGKDTDPQTVQRIREKLLLKTSFQEEILNYSKDGRPYWLSLSITPILNEVGDVDKFIAIEMDITEKKEKEKLIQERNKDLEASLKYAKTIQKALLPDTDVIKTYCKDYFIYFQPKEEIGGDFYWFQKHDDTLYIVTADCTGHGVPGALLSMYFQQYLNTLAVKYAHVSLHEKLKALQEGILKLQNEQGIQDAFEMSMAMIDNQKVHLFTTSAQPILLQNNLNQIEILKSDNYLGNHPLHNETNSFEFFVKDKQQVKRLFLMSDGMIDQFGGPENKKFGLTRLKSIVASNTDFSLAQTIKEIKFSLNTWFNGLEQTDDFLMIGLEL